MSNDSTNHVIGLSVDIEIEGINGARPIRAKVDTGADVCSLHARDLEVIGMIEMAKTVRFRYNDRIYTLPIEGFQTVVSASGSTQRPLVFLDVRINGQFIEHVQFNLADRSDMDTAVLIGKNLLDVCGFVIDPTREEEEQTAPSQEEEENKEPEQDDAQLVTFPTVEIVSFSQSQAHNIGDNVHPEHETDQTDDQSQQGDAPSEPPSDAPSEMSRQAELFVDTFGTLIDFMGSQPDSGPMLQRLQDLLTSAINKGA